MNDWKERLNAHHVAELVDDDIIASAMRIAQRVGIAQPSGAKRIARWFDAGKQNAWTTLSGEAAVEFGLAALNAMRWIGGTGESDASHFWVGALNINASPALALIERSCDLAVVHRIEEPNVGSDAPVGAVCSEPALFAATMIALGLRGDPVRVYSGTTGFALGDREKGAVAFGLSVDGGAAAEMFGLVASVFPEAFSAPLDAQTFAERARFRLAARADGFYGDDDERIAETLVFRSPFDAIQFRNQLPTAGERIPAQDIVGATPNDRLCVALVSAAAYLRDVFRPESEEGYWATAERASSAAVIFGYSGRLTIVRPIDFGSKTAYREIVKREREAEARRRLRISDPLNQFETDAVVEAVVGFIGEHWGEFAQEAKRRAQRITDAAAGRGMHLANIAYGFRHFIGEGETLNIAERALRDAGVETPSAALRNDPFDDQERIRIDREVAEWMRGEMNL